MNVTLLFSSTFWREGTNFHLKRRNLLTPLHSVTSGKTSILSVRAYCTTSDKGGRPARMYKVESSWNVVAHGDARDGKWRGNWRMEWVAITLHTTSEHGVSSITTADAHISAASSRLNWRPRRVKWTRPFRRKTKFGFCACAITFKTQSNVSYY